MRIRGYVLGLLACAAFAWSSPARADFALSQTWFVSLDDTTRGAVQASLVILGLYDGLIDGKFGPGTYKALIAYQNKPPPAGDGVLSASQVSDLENQASVIYARLGIQEVRDAEAGLGIYLPSKLFTAHFPLGALVKSDLHGLAGNSYSTPDALIALETMKIPAARATLGQVFALLTAPSTDATITYSSLVVDRLTIIGTQAGRAALPGRHSGRAVPTLPGRLPP